MSAAGALRRRETLLVGVLAVGAGLRVLAFAAAFPFFSNVDEQKHVDVVLKYARGDLPGPGDDAYEPVMGRLLATYGSPEYLLEPGGEAPPPFWQQTEDVRVRKIRRNEAFLARRANKEAHQPPVYYAVAAAWLHVGRALGLSGGAQLYWVRAWNALAAGLLVWLAHRFLRPLYPDEALLRLGVPALLAVFPMDAFYYVTRDALSPLLAGVGFFLALRVAREPHSGAGVYAATGALAAAAFLAKYTNVVLLGVCALCSAVALYGHGAGRRIRARLVLLWGVALVPVIAWLVRNLVLFGDPTATALKAQRLGWQPKPLWMWWDHPIFTPAGWLAFATELPPRFWRGELAWHQETLAAGFADGVYTVTSLAALALAAWSLRRRRAPGRRLVEGAALLHVLGSAAVLATLSLMYVFTETSNPPASHPYFTHGRLVAGALVPFLILYLRGIDVATERLPRPARGVAAWSIVAGVALVVGVSELRLTQPVFLSAYNWYHLP